MKMKYLRDKLTHTGVFFKKSAKLILTSIKKLHEQGMVHFVQNALYFQARWARLRKINIFFILFTDKNILNIVKNPTR